MRTLRPAVRARRAELRAKRAHSDAALRRFADAAVPGDGTCLAGRVLVDGMWDNPNYWFRLMLARRALGLSGSRMFGLIGTYARREVAASFTALADAAIVDYRKLSAVTSVHRVAAADLLASVRRPDDILALKLPNGLPSEILYDGILKRQRCGMVDIDDPRLFDCAAEQLACIDAAARLFDEIKPDLVLLSHGVNFSYGSLAWEAIRRGVPVLLLYGDYGTTRFIRLEKPGDIFAYPSRPQSSEIAALSPSAFADLVRVGDEHLALRRGGLTNDPGAQLAYASVPTLSKASICAELCWDAKRPIIGIYAANPFDFPHSNGMSHFRDFVDWNRETIAAAARNGNANFLCKPHPIDQRYGVEYGEGMADAVAAVAAPNVRMAKESWRGTGLLQCLSGVVTHHGTIGLEAAALGIPILTTDHVWYDQIGFVARPISRASYLGKLESAWWDDRPSARATELAKLAAGLYFGVPDWQGDYMLRDDSDQWLIYGELEKMIARHDAAITRETALIRDWYLAKHPFFHMYKIFRTERFRVGNAVA